LVDVEHDDQPSIDVGEADARVGAGEARERVVPRKERLELQLAAGRFDEQPHGRRPILELDREHDERRPRPAPDWPPCEAQPCVDRRRRLSAEAEEPQQGGGHPRDPRDRRRVEDLPDAPQVDGELPLTNVEGQVLHRGS
jgi:hypothetical protein